ncbi:MAG TPA: hypothetical protein VE400_26700, partial [Mycobacterium sp.]|nr:hypothetical protein [Mycobacterium sp.]
LEDATHDRINDAALISSTSFGDHRGSGDHHETVSDFDDNRRVTKFGRSCLAQQPRPRSHHDLADDDLRGCPEHVEAALCPPGWMDDCRCFAAPTIH